MNLRVKFTSKNLKSIKKFVHFVFKKCGRIHDINILFEKHLSKTNKRFTILKSPHVNKKAKQSFFFPTYCFELVLECPNLKKSLFFLKQTTKILFSDVKINISHYTGSRRSLLCNSLRLIPLKRMDCFGEKSF